MPDGRIDMRFPHLHFPRNDTLLRSIPLQSLHRKGMEGARTFSSFDSRLQFRPFTVSPVFLEQENSATLDVAPFAAPTRASVREGTSRSAFGDYVISDDCMQISKHRLAAKPQRSKVFGSMCKKTNCPGCRQVDSAVGMWTVPTPRLTIETFRRVLVRGHARAEDAFAVGFAEEPSNGTSTAIEIKNRDH